MSEGEVRVSGVDLGRIRAKSKGAGSFVTEKGEWTWIDIKRLSDRSSFHTSTHQNGLMSFLQPSRHSSTTRQGNFNYDDHIRTLKFQAGALPMYVLPL